MYRSRTAPSPFRAGTLSLRSLVLRDRSSGSRATLSGSWDGSTLALSFDGRLPGPTLDRLMEHPGVLTGVISGQVHLQVPVAQPARTTGQGTLELKNVTLGGEPSLTVEWASLRLAGDELRLQPARLLLGDVASELRGTASRSSEGWNLDLDAVSPLLNVEALRPLLAPRPNATQTPAGPFRGLPLRGTVRLTAGSLRYGGFTWKPVQATVRLTPSGIEAEVARAELCGIATPGTLSTSSGSVRLKIQPDAKELPLAPALSCLWGVDDPITGTASIQAEVSVAGAPGHLLAGSQGHIQFSAADGRIHRYDLLGRIFALLNVTEVFRGRLPDLAGEGLGYKSIRSSGKLRDGVLEFEEGVVDGASLTLFWHGTWDLNRDDLDLTVVVAPFKTLDAVVRHVPLLGYVLGDSLVAVPVRVRGPRADPQVVPLDPAAVGTGLLGVVKRTLRLPLHLIQPLLGQGKP